MSEPVKELTYEVLKRAVESAAAFRCRRRLQPAGGEGDKIFPPTYAGAVYAIEQRRIPGEPAPVTCVVLDSVQSQANRMEEALQDAMDDCALPLPLIVVDFSEADIRLQKPIGKVTSLTAPHRLADAILRDSWIKGTKVYFSNSDYSTSWRKCDTRNATGIFELCPTALVFGVWGSPDQPGVGARFERCIVSEIVGVNASFGLKTASRIDPLEIRAGAGPIYKRKGGNWTTNPEEAIDEIDAKTKKPTGRKALFREKKSTDGKPTLVFINPTDLTYPDQGKPSSANHGNIPPSFAKYTDNAEGPDVMRPPGVRATYSISSIDGSFTNESALEGGARDARKGQIAPGGVTVDFVEQMTTLSLIQLRRLRFPSKDQTATALEQNRVARSVLASIGLCAATMAFENGSDLRSRCLVFPEQKMEWELLESPGEDAKRYSLTSKQARELVLAAIEDLKKTNLQWNTTPLLLTPSDSLVAIVAKSQQLGATEED